ncbi:hypothetical protein RclHR1_15160003 [Rhizophagus clarus]|uniref:F-box domain-containing protein n=1 Tax=Rhizophagus clarus TaxID=94130 RepID=A0A2Z6QIR7_9GLOM|nr:hypothetical protein RclHR1_15160003 [Rhizophagus clarus]GES79674.1 hypothetical protein GLOIN_2v1773642 [Rhizophagus clarus]
MDRKSIISLPEDCTYEIIQQLPEETSILYKFLFVNRFWCKCIITILWKIPFNKINEDKVRQARLINTYLGCLDEEEKNYIEKENFFNLPPTKKPFFNYAKYLIEFTISELDSSVRAWYINYEELKYNDIIERIMNSIYHLFIRSNNNHLESLEFKQGWIHSWNWDKVLLQDNTKLLGIKELNIELHEDLKEGGDYTLSDLKFYNILLSRCNYLQILSIYFTPHKGYLKYFSSNQIIKMIQVQKNLQILNISNFYQYGSELTKIISSLGYQINSLKELRFIEVNFTNCSLIGLKICSNLDTMFFDSCHGLTIDHINSLSNSSFKLKSLYFYDQLIIYQNIITKILSLFGNSLTKFGTSLLTDIVIEIASIRCPNIKCLIINMDNDDDLHYEIFHWIYNLELLELDITIKIRDTSKFFQLLGNNLPNTLKILKLDCSYISHDSLKNLFTSRIDLEKLIFRNSYEFNYECLMVIYEYIRYYKNFKELTFKTYKKEWSLRDSKVLNEIKKYCPLVNCEFDIPTVEEMLDECILEDFLY